MAVIFSLAKVSKAAPLGTAFTYQGRLLDDNAAADGVYDFQFKLYDDPDIVIGQQTGSVVNVRDVDVIDGYFTVELDFGSSVFDGNAVWLEIGVLRHSIEYDPFVYTPLSPLQEITPMPYALYARTAGPDNDWMLSGNDIYSIPSGNVGIGTSTPMYRLHTVDTTPSSDAPAIYGEHAVTDFYGIGVQGVSLYKGVAGSVSATGSSSYYGVFGSASTSNTGGIVYGVYGSGSGGATSYGVYGNGSSYGVYGKNNSSGNFGYLGGDYGAYGKNNNSGNYGYFGSFLYGVYGKHSFTGNYGYLGSDSYGVYGVASSGLDYGVYGYNSGTNAAGYLGGVYGVYGSSGSTYAGYFNGPVYVYSNMYVGGNVSASSFTDRTPYPKDLAAAYQAVMSMERLPDGQYMQNDKETQLDHSTLSDFIRGEDGHRNLSATVSCLNEVVKDLVKKQQYLSIELTNSKLQIKELQQQNMLLKAMITNSN